MTLTFAAALFDMDGTLIDSTPCVARLWREWAEAEGLDADEVLANMHGVRGLEVIARYVAPERVEACYQSILQREQVELDGTVALPGIHARWAELAGAPLAVVTSAARSLMQTKLPWCGLGIPAAAVCAEDVSAGKPDPAPYLAGAGLLNADPARCVAFEDAPSGVRSARAAGMTVIALTTSHSANELAEAHHIISGWDALTFSTGAQGVSVHFTE
ncbi:HAD family hydrolase [Chitinibacteraceae bacterium HSL-7]